MIDAALALARMGRRVFPVTPGEKEPPLVCGWPELATSDPARIAKWWAKWPMANPAVACGWQDGADDNGQRWFLFVLEADPRHGAQAWWQRNFDRLTPTYAVRSGGGGIHLYYLSPVEVRNSAGQLAAGMDTRGLHGYALGAGSVHPSGKVYTHVGGVAHIAHAPDWLIAGLERKQQPPRQRVVAHAPVGWQGAPVEAVYRKWLAKARNGNRNDVGYRLACDLLDNNAAPYEAEDTMRRYAGAVGMDGKPYTEREALASLNSAMRASRREPWPMLSHKTRVAA